MLKRNNVTGNTRTAGTFLYFIGQANKATAGTFVYITGWVIIYVFSVLAFVNEEEDAGINSVKVINLTTQLLHKWSPSVGSSLPVYTICRKMRCGTQLSPMKHSVFETSVPFDESHFTLCTLCF